MDEQKRVKKITEFSNALRQLCDAYIDEGILTYAEMLGILELTKADTLQRLYEDLDDANE